MEEERERSERARCLASVLTIAIGGAVRTRPGPSVLALGLALGLVSETRGEMAGLLARTGPFRLCDRQRGSDRSWSERSRSRSRPGSR